MSAKCVENNATCSNTVYRFTILLFRNAKKKKLLLKYELRSFNDNYKRYCVKKIPSPRRNRTAHSVKYAMWEQNLLCMTHGLQNLHLIGRMS